MNAQRRTSCLVSVAFTALLAAAGCATLEQRQPVLGEENSNPATSSRSQVQELIPQQLPDQQLLDQQLLDQQPLDQQLQMTVHVAAVQEEVLPASEPDPQAAVYLDDVLAAVERDYPLLQAVEYTRDIAAGEHLAAHGAYDLKLKAGSENGPVGFYPTYRQFVGFDQPGYWGGSVFGGYRIGRGSFQPWYLERQTDEGGEFKAGLELPLARNRAIDARRADLWRTAVGRQLAEPEIRLQRISFVQSASYAYWEWVAAGHRRQIAEALLQIARGRDGAIRRKVEAGDTDPPVLQDNRRLIVSREAKLIEAERKLSQSAIKLSLFYRDEQGLPIVADIQQLPDFPEISSVAADQVVQSDIDRALNQRPEMQLISMQSEQLQIDLAEMQNNLLPDVQAVVAASQDVGSAASSKNDKSPFELEAALYLDVPVQRRKAQGKIRSIEAKLGQLNAKRRMLQDKIATEVRVVHVALVAAQQQIERARESVKLADELAQIEQRKFEVGEADLLAVNLREQQAAEAQTLEIDALQEYFSARADYRAVLAAGRP